MANISVTRRLHIDTLEQRDVPSAYFYEGEVVVYVPDNDAIVKLTKSGSTRAPKLNVIVNGALELTETIKFVWGRGAEDVRIERIRVIGGAGNDSITNNTNVKLIAFGGAGHDVLRGGSNGDELYGQDGEDTIFGNKGNDRLGAYWMNGVWHDDAHADLIDGGDGNDTLAGGSGNDELNGNKHNDELWGDTGNDYMHGGVGNDLMFGGLHDDYMNGEEGRDTLLGNAGNDKIIGGPNEDALWGRDGANDNGVFNWGDQDSDTLQGGIGSDYLNGQASDDYLMGEGGNDIIDGGDGDDVLTGGDGNDELNGDAGNDGLLGGWNDERDILRGGADADRYLVAPGERDVISPLNDAQDATMKFQANGVAWNDTAILAVDKAFQWATAMTNNTRLLKLANGNGLTFKRVATIATSPGLVTLADNDSAGTIRVTNAAFRVGENLAETIIHELGHNWDTATENDSISDFHALSGWKNWTVGTAIPTGYTPAVNLNGVQQPYLHFTNAVFVSSYAHTNPLEDFCESLAMFYSNTWPESLWAAKHGYIEDFLADLRTGNGGPVGGGGGT